MKENRKQLFTYFLISLLIVQGVAIFLINLTQTENYLFFDNALAIRHGIEIWRNGLFLEGYNYFSTMEIDNAAFFAIPLYFLTNNLGLSLGIVHVILYVLCVFLVYSLFKNGGYDVTKGLLAAFLIFTPYEINQLDWGNMLFVTVGQYQFRVMVMLSITNLLLMAFRPKADTKKMIPFFIFNALLCFWTTLSCGNYVLLMILFPFCLFYIYWNCILDKSVMNKHVIAILIGTALVCFLALVIRSNGIGETSRGNLALLTADTFPANFLNCITGVFMLFGGVTQDPTKSILSLGGILQVIKFLFISLCLVITYLKLKKIKNTDYLHYMFVFVVLVNMLVMMLTVTRYGAVVFEYRYHIVWGAMLLIVTMVSMDAIPYSRLQKVIFGAMIGMVLFINVGGFQQIRSEVHATDEVRQMIEVADEKQLNTIYVYNMPDEAAMIRVLDLDKSCMSVTYVVDHVYVSSDNYFEDYSRYYTYDEEHLLVCPPDCFEPLPEDIKACYTPMGTLGRYSLYISSENPWLSE